MVGIIAASRKLAENFRQSASLHRWLFKYYYLAASRKLAEISASPLLCIGGF
jgi:hypothetical protein